MLLSFYYPENPLIGKKIWEGPGGAIYEKGMEPYHSDLPSTFDFGRKNPVFCSYQLMGSSPFSLVACLHNYKREDRERRPLYSFDIVDVFRKLAYTVSSEGAVFILEKMRRNWNSVPQREIDIHSWSSTVSLLIDRIRCSEKAMSAFRENHPNLLCLRRMNSVYERNRRQQARAWLHEQDKPYILVQSAFERLSYPTLESVCEEHGGFVVNDQPLEKEGQGFAILEEIILILYQAFFSFEDGLPIRKIIRNQSASYHGMATLFKNRQLSYNIEGLASRYRVGEIYLKENIFRKDRYYDAIATYVHEYCHTFGGDSSESFSRGLTYAMEILMKNSNLIEQYKKRWEVLYPD